MANRRQLVKRRRTVRNIRKITRTMQLIATARFQKAMSRATATRPYAEKLAEMVREATRSVANVKHALLRTPEGDRSALIVITSNRGLCGGYNGNILRTALANLRERREAGETVDVHMLGKKGISYFRFLDEEMTSKSTEIDDRPRFEQVSPIADRMMEAFSEGQLAKVHVCYMRFMSAGVQRPEIMQLLPLKQDAAKKEGEEAIEEETGGETTFDFTPEPAELLEELLPATVRMRLFQCFTDAAVSEQVARMVAMKAATDAAGDMIRLLTQQYNRARQTAITMELLDIIGGATAIS